jgi:rhodanese-related sulfurtransferase
MRRVLFLVLIVLALGCAGTAFCAETALTVDNVPKMTVDELKGRLNNPDLVVIDVRSAYDWEESATKIKGTVREDPRKLASWLSKYPESKTIVFYCSCANEETSGGMALQLIAKGYKKVYALKGGWKPWELAKYPVDPKGAD